MVVTVVVATVVVALFGTIELVVVAFVVVDATLVVLALVGTVELVVVLLLDDPQAVTANTAAVTTASRHIRFPMAGP